MLAAALGLSAPHVSAADEAPGSIERIDLKTEAAVTKVIVMLSRPLPFRVNVLGGEEARKTAKRLVLDFDDTTLAAGASAPIEVGDGLVQRIRTGQPAPGKTRIVVDLEKDVKHTIEAYETPPHVTVAIIDTAPTSGVDAASPPPTSSGKAPVLLAPHEPLGAR